MNEENKNAENRLLAALAHASVVAQGVGILVGVVVYITQRDKSRFAALQGLQAAVFQLLNLVIAIVMWLLWGACYGLSMIPLIIQAEANPNAAPPAIFWLSLASMIFPLLFMVAVALYGLWGALRSWQGADFRYPLIGAWLEKGGLWQPAPPESPVEG